jgi:hypothetical protein
MKLGSLNSGPRVERVWGVKICDKLTVCEKQMERITAKIKAFWSLLMRIN